MSLSRWAGSGIYLWVALVFLLSELLSSWLGIRFAHETLGTLYQYLDPVILRDDLLRGLYHLHAQPPLFNAFLGLVLKLFPDSYPAVFSFLFGAMALGVLAGIAFLMRRAGVSDRMNGVVCLVFALSPNFLVYRDWLFYTLPVAFCLVAAAVLLVRGVERESWPLVGGFLAISTVVMLTRAVFHPLWLLVTVFAIAACVGRPLRRPLILGAFVSLCVVNLWFLKNYIVVGTYTGSSWLGMSLTKRWPLSQREMAELEEAGIVPPFWQRRPFQEPRELMPFGFFGPSGNAHPAIDAPYKSNGEPNFNHRDYIRLSRELLAADLRLIWLYPGRYLERTVTAFMLYLQPGPNSVHFLVEYDFERVHAFRDLLTRYVFLGDGIERPIRALAPPPNLMFVVFPVLLGAASWQLRPQSEDSRGRRALFAFMLATIVWVTLVTNLVEIGENDRMRWEVSPFLAILLGSIATSSVRRLWRRFSE